MNPRRLEALRAMAAQNDSPNERDIAVRALERHYAKHPEDRPKLDGTAPAGRKTVYPGATASSNTTTSWSSTDPTGAAFRQARYATPGGEPLTWADLKRAMDDLADVFNTPRADPGDVKHAPPCPLCKHKHARTGTWCSFCAIQGIVEDCQAYFGPQGWATFDGGPLA